MKVGVPKEIKNHEYRVGLVPASVRELTNRGHKVFVQTTAGAGIGLAVPADNNKHGYIAEHHGFGMTQRACADYVEDMAAAMLARTQGIDLDPDTAYNERKDIYRAKGLVVKTRAAVQTVEGDKNGLWTTALAAAVFIL